MCATVSVLQECGRNCRQSWQPWRLQMSCRLAECMEAQIAMQCRQLSPRWTWVPIYGRWNDAWLDFLPVYTTWGWPWPMRMVYLSRKWPHADIKLALRKEVTVGMTVTVTIFWYVFAHLVTVGSILFTIYTETDTWWVHGVNGWDTEEERQRQDTKGAHHIPES